MEQAIAKAGALIEAMEYIRSFRERIVVVKLGGSVLDDADLQKKLLTDIAFMDTFSSTMAISKSVSDVFSIEVLLAVIDILSSASRNIILNE